LELYDELLKDCKSNFYILFAGLMLLPSSDNSQRHYKTFKP